MATVITNLFSAIPWIGQDLVELDYYYFSSLPTFGIINKKSNQPLRSNKEKLYALNISKSYLSMFKGLIDGDGYIGITKTKNDYIRINKVLNLNISEENKLRNIQNKLKIGRINVYPKHNVVQYNIPRTDLQEILIPLIFFHNLIFITDTRRQQFNKKIFILENANHLKKKSHLKKAEKNNQIPNIKVLPDIFTDYKLKLDNIYFKNWLIGFTIAKGSFNIKQNKEACFSITQREHLLLFEYIKEIFKTNIKINNYKGFMKFEVTSKKDIQNVINFFNDSELEPLLGKKAIQYKNWLNEIKKVKKI